MWVVLLHATEVLLRRFSETVGEDRRSVLAALAVPYDGAALVKVQVLYAEPEAFGQAEPTPVEQAGNEDVGPRVHGGE